MTKTHTRLPISDEKSKPSISLSKKTHASVSVDAAKESKDYWLIMKHTFSEQAARTLQRAFRKKHHYQFKGKYNETLNGPLTMRFLKEPLDQKYLEHVKHIKKGDYLNLDFSDPDFIRNIYKALRLKLIDANELATVTLWHDAIDFLQEKPNKLTISLHSFTNEGPYDPTTISYATPKAMTDFQLALKELPEKDRTYLTIDLPHDHEIMLLLIIMIRLTEEDSDYSKKFISFIEKYLAKTSGSKEINRALLHNFINLSNEEHASVALDFLTKQFSIAYPSIYIPHYHKSNIATRVAQAIMQAATSIEKSKLSYRINNYLLLAGVLVADEEMPSLIISANYNKDDPTSPLLSIVLPTIPSLYILQKALHNDDTTYPELTVGQLSPRDILQTLMKPKHNLRPVELVHPDVKQQENPHDVTTTAFMLTWHDYFHTWRNGSNTYKDIICHIITSLQRYKRFDMSRTIWKLTDMDTNTGKIVRNFKKSGINPSMVKIAQLMNLLNETISKETFFTILEHYDQNLLIIIDMVINREIWKKYLDTYPEDLLHKDGIGWKSMMEKAGLAISYSDYVTFFSILANMRKIIYTYPQSDTYSAAIFYILCMRLKNNREGLAALDKVNSLGLSHFFQWERNGDIYHLDTDRNKVYIHSRSPEKLCTLLNKIIKSYQPDKDTSVLVRQSLFTPPNRDTSTELSSAVAPTIAIT